MIILGIETSCDETAAAIVENGTRVLSSVVASSQDLHKKYGGIIPEEAAREQVKCIIPVIEESIKNAKGITNIKKIDAMAVTVEPGLIGSLLIGIEAAKTLSFAIEKPLIPVNHLIAHIYANFINSQLDNLKIRKLFPALCLIASGGHTELLLMKSHQEFKWLGGTRDDAAGECFDKCARLLGLGYPGGPEIERAAKLSTISYQQSTISLPRPMRDQNNLDFSFSGLKTAVARFIEKNHQLSIINHQPLIAFELQEAITDCLVEKTLKAAEKFKPKSLMIAGGVGANTRLREKFKKNTKIELFLPPKNLCTDNAVVVASRAFFNFKPVPWRKIRANPSLKLNT